MAEKTGALEKLVYDFDTTGALEVCFGDDQWFRVTATKFRSFDGKRRITTPTTTIRKVVDVPMETKEYFGPVYLLQTNIEVIQQTSNTTVTNLDSHQRLR
jgi:hypothetical protein